jgi:hypothetical protein
MMTFMAAATRVSGKNNMVANGKVINTITNHLNNARSFMTKHHGQWQFHSLLFNCNIRVTYSGSHNPHQHFIGSWPL